MLRTIPPVDLADFKDSGGILFRVHGGTWFELLPGSVHTTGEVAMKSLAVTLFLSLVLFCGAGCHTWSHAPDFTPPSSPTGLRTSTGDNFIELFWNANREPDVAGYNVYVSSSYGGRYGLIASAERPYYNDLHAKNGTVYYYAVTAYDFDGNESDLSKDVAYDIPRPEGYDVTLINSAVSTSNSAYDFSKYAVVAAADQYADIVYGGANGDYRMTVGQDSDIRDMGPTQSILDISESPASGWATTHDVALAAGHTYVVWTWDDHYAKFRVSALSQNRVVFDWAYQTVPTNRLLKRTVPSRRPV
jgi:hypothetical protein